MPTQAATAALLGNGVSERLVQRLVASDRLRSRLLALLDRRLGPLPALDSAQARALAMDEAGLCELCRQAGAVWQRAAIAALVDGASVRSLTGLIGEDLRALALRSPGWGLPPIAASPDTIAAMIPSVGAACWADWCASQPPALVRRLAWRPPEGATPGAPGGAAAVAWLLDQP